MGGMISGLFGGGGGGSTTYNVPKPAAPTPIDYNKMYAAATRSSIATMREQEASIKRLVPTYENLQFNTVNRLARGLDNQYLGTLRNTISREMGAAATPSAIESRLQQDAEAELALGRSLSPEQTREATQSARAAFAARGMATGNAAAGAEILNRDAYGTARQDQRRQNALGANQLDLARRQRLLGLAGGYAALDPFARATDAGFQVGTANTGTASNLIGQTFGNSMNTAGNVQSFNTNMQAGMYNSWQNNNAAIQAANITGRASQQAGQMAMMGGMMQGAGSIAGGFMSDKRVKKDIKPVGKDGVLGLKTYEYRYKGESKDAPTRVGFMAQDVQKVLPEAVEEVDYKGKKRLALKPMVIGQALAAALTAQQDEMFAQGYTVGKGFGRY